MRSSIGNSESGRVNELTGLGAGFRRFRLRMSVILTGSGILRRFYA
jgi:hypothetical protein